MPICVKFAPNYLPARCLISEMSLTLLDTDMVSELVRLSPQVSRRAQEYAAASGPLQLSVITHYEVLSGFFYKDARQQLSRYEAIVALSDIVQLTVASVEISARVEADLRRRGSSIGHTDTLIAGLALANNLMLATNNTRHFERIEGLQLVNWTQQG